MWPSERRISAVVALALMLASCGSEFAGDDGGAPGSTLNPERAPGQATTSIDTADGDTVVQRTGRDVPVELPDGLSLFPDARVIANTVTDGVSGKQTTVMFTTEALPLEIADYYRSAAAKAGMELAIDLEFDRTSTLAADRAADPEGNRVGAGRFHRAEPVDGDSRIGARAM